LDPSGPRDDLAALRGDRAAGLPMAVPAAARARRDGADGSDHRLGEVPHSCHQTRFDRHHRERAVLLQDSVQGGALPDQSGQRDGGQLGGAPSHVGDLPKAVRVVRRPSHHPPEQFHQFPTLLSTKDHSAGDGWFEERPRDLSAGRDQVSFGSVQVQRQLEESLLGQLLQSYFGGGARVHCHACRVGHPPGGADHGGQFEYGHETHPGGDHQDVKSGESVALLQVHRFGGVPQGHQEVAEVWTFAQQTHHLQELLQLWTFHR
jgi:hypothetical protein